MTDLGPLYSISIDLCGLDEVEDWGTTHAAVEMVAASEQRGDGYTSTDVVAAYRWTAGVMARVAVTLAAEINGSQTLPYRSPMPATSELAWVYGDNLCDLDRYYRQRWEVPGLVPPSVGVEVPASHGSIEEWFARAQELLATEMTAALAQPDHHHDDGHSRVVPAETSSITSPEERTQ